MLPHPTGVPPWHEICIHQQGTGGQPETGSLPHVPTWPPHEVNYSGWDSQLSVLGLRQQAADTRKACPVRHSRASCAASCSHLGPILAHLLPR